MLVLTRRVGEEIVIGGDIRITVSAIQGNRVRIGVHAPDSVRVDRKEVSERRAEFPEESQSAAAIRRQGQRHHALWATAL
jgi:carbon storage regulator